MNYRGASDRNPAFRYRSLATFGMTVTRWEIVLTGVLRRKILLVEQDPSLRPG